MTKVTLFSQIISKLDKSIFKRLVFEKQTDKYQKGFNSCTHLVSMLFCQFAKSQAVRGGLRQWTSFGNRQLDYDGNLPLYVNITDGKTADNKGVSDLPLIKGSVIVADRFYSDFNLLNIWDSNGVFFVVRHKENLQYRTVKEMDLPANRHQHILKDEIIELKNTKYPKQLRRVTVWNEEKQFVVEIITNQMTWTANTVSELYKSR